MVSQVYGRGSGNGTNVGTVNKGTCIDSLSDRDVVSTILSDTAKDQELPSSTGTKIPTGNPTKLENILVTITVIRATKQEGVSLVLALTLV